MREPFELLLCFQGGGGGGVLFEERWVWFLGSLSLELLLDFDHFFEDYVHFSLELDMVSTGV